MSGVVEEKVYTGKCVDLNENLGNWAQYKIKSNNVDLFNIIPQNSSQINLGKATNSSIQLGDVSSTEICANAKNIKITASSKQSNEVADEHYL